MRYGYAHVRGEYKRACTHDARELNDEIFLRSIYIAFIGQNSVEKTNNLSRVLYFLSDISTNYIYLYSIKRFSNSVKKILKINRINSSTENFCLGIRSNANSTITRTSKWSNRPFRNGRWRIGVEVNAWSLKARGFQQVLSRTWSMQVCGSKHSSLWRPLTCAHSTCAQSGPVYFCFPSRELAEALSKSVPQQQYVSLISLVLSLSLLSMPLLRALSFRSLRACSMRIVVRSDVNKFPREMRAENVSQLISCWRNMAVIKCAFSLYGMHSRRPLGSCNHRVAKLRLENISPWCATWPVVIRIKRCFFFFHVSLACKFNDKFYNRLLRILSNDTYKVL